MMMSRAEDENVISGMANSAVKRVSRCSPVAVFLRGLGGLHLQHGDPRIERRNDFPTCLDSEEPLVLEDYPWARSYVLRSLTGALGYLVVGADSEPGHDELFLIGVLAQETGSALGAVRALTDQRRTNHELQQVVQRLERQTETMRVLAGVAAEEVDGAHLASSLSSLTGLPVSVEDHFGHRLSWASPDGDEPPTLSTRRFDALMKKVRPLAEPMRSGKRWVSAATAAGEVLGLLVLHDASGTATKADLFALSHASTVLSVELQKVRSIAWAELRSRRELADELLVGKAGEGAVSRGAALGHDLNRSQQVVAIGWDKHPNEDLLHSMIGAMAAKLDIAFLVALRTQMALLIAPETDRWEQAHSAAQGCTGIGATQVSMGVGGACDNLRRIPRSCLEATQALSVRSASDTPSGVTVFGELGVFRVLAAASTNPELKSFVQDWLGPLIDYDEQHGSDLVPTLSAFLESGGHYDQTASAMIIHRSTLRYRLSRIRELSGMDLSDIDTRFNLHVATRAWKLHAPP
jgi:DNA-binding PucR family transcriptional regulator